MRRGALSLAVLVSVALAGARATTPNQAPEPPPAADLESRRAAIERRLVQISGHDSTKASIRYPYDLGRVVALGRRPLPGGAEPFDLEREFRRSDELLRALESGRDLLWRSTGDRARHHYLEPADEILPYRVYVPTRWNGATPLPLLLMLHGGGATENTSMDNDDGLLKRLGERHGYIVVCPLGYRPGGGFGNRSSLFRQAPGSRSRRPVGLAGSVARNRELELSERDAMQVLDLVAAEYGVDPRRIYLAGHSMGSGGAWHLAATHPDRFAALAPMSGPMVDEAALERVRGLPIFITEGTGSSGTVAASRALHEFMKQEKFDVQYLEVDASHVGVVPVALPRIFEFFDRRARR